MTTIDSYSFTYDALSRRVEYGTGSSFTQYLYAPFDATLNLGAASAHASPSLRIPTPGGGQAILGASGVTDYRRPNWQQSQPIDSSTTRTALSDASYSAYGEHYDENGYSGFFAGNLSIYPVFMDGYAATWRLYHYDQNRWISPDPAGLSAVDPSDPQTWNRYSYARGNPLGTIDPSGLDGNGTICYALPVTTVSGGGIPTYGVTIVCAPYAPPPSPPAPNYAKSGGGSNGGGGASGNLGLTNRQACYADAVVNGALGFVPGVQRDKDGCIAGRFQFQPGTVPKWQYRASYRTRFRSLAGPSRVADSATNCRWAASAGAIYANTSYAVAGGASALNRAQGLATRASFLLKSASGQAGILQQAASLERLAQLASAAKNLGTVFSLASTAFDLYQCSQKP